MDGWMDLTTFMRSGSTEENRSKMAARSSQHIFQASISHWIYYIARLSNTGLTTHGKTAAEALSHSHHVTSVASSIRAPAAEGTFSAMSSRHHNII